MAVLVWVDGWQMQCCGNPFAVGDEIEWTLDVPDTDWLETALDADLARAIGYAQEHHGEDEYAATTIATVLNIRIAHGQYAPGLHDEQTLYPVPGSLFLTEVERVDGSESDINELRLNGYVVKLEVAVPQT